MPAKDNIYSIIGRDAIHPFPARMAPSIALENLVNIREGQRVLDPMMGSGTVLAVARSNGHHAFGVDIDPLAVLLSRVWTTSIDAEDVTQTAQKVLGRARRRFEKMSVANAYPQKADEETRKFIRYWFDGYARRQLTALSCEIEKVEDDKIRDVLWCAFSRLIISKQAGASLAMDLSHSRPHKSYTTAPVKPFNRFEYAVQKVNQNCLDQKAKNRGPVARVFNADARDIPIKDGFIDIVLTSPPYLNAIDYMRCSKFSLVWMGYSVSAIRKIRNVSVGSEARFSRDECKDIRDTVLANLSLKPELSPRNMSILERYIDDMFLSMKEAFRVLVSGGKAVYVIGENTIRGTFIRNADILAIVGESLNFSVMDRRARVLPANRRYLPPPAKKDAPNKMDLRMRREIVLTFAKP